MNKDKILEFILKLYVQRGGSMDEFHRVRREGSDLEKRVFYQQNSILNVGMYVEDAYELHMTTSSGEYDIPELQEIREKIGGYDDKTAQNYAYEAIEEAKYRVPDSEGLVKKISRLFESIHLKPFPQQKVASDSRIDSSMRAYNSLLHTRRMRAKFDDSIVEEYVLGKEVVIVGGIKANLANLHAALELVGNRPMVPIGMIGPGRDAGRVAFEVDELASNPHSGRVILPVKGFWENVYGLVDETLADVDLGSRLLVPADAFQKVMDHRSFIPPARVAYNGSRLDFILQAGAKARLSLNLHDQGGKSSAQRLKRVPDHRAFDNANKWAAAYCGLVSDLGFFNSQFFIGSGAVCKEKQYLADAISETYKIMKRNLISVLFIDSSPHPGTFRVSIKNDLSNSLEYQWRPISAVESRMVKPSESGREVYIVQVGTSLNPSDGPTIVEYDRAKHTISWSQYDRKARGWQLLK